MFEVTPTFIAIVSASAIRDDIELFLDRHSIGTLAAAYKATLVYLNGWATCRMAVKKIGLELYEGITIPEEIESVRDEMCGTDPYLADQLGDESGVSCFESFGARLPQRISSPTTHTSAIYEDD